MQVKGRSGNLGLLAQGGNGYLFIGCILEQFQKRILNHAFSHDSSSICFSYYQFRFLHKTGGKQYKVSEGDVIKVEKLGNAVGETVTFDQVLLVNDADVKVGNPTVAGATVTASVVAEGKDRKVIVYKYKRKTGYHKKNGHRQLFTKVKIEKINA